MLHAIGDYILFSDADLSTPIEELDKFFQYFNESYDIVIGSRKLKIRKLKFLNHYFEKFQVIFLQVYALLYFYQI